MSQINVSDLENANAQKGAARALAFLKLSGPGWVQSAIALGGGTLAGSLFLGIIGGYQMLWVQPLAVALGVVLLAAISYVTLSIERSPFEAIKSEINPALAWLWLASALVASAVWIIPQFALSYAVISQNLLPSGVIQEDTLSSKLLVTVVLYFIVALITLSYGGDGRGRKTYESALKVLIALVVLSFGVVVCKLTFTGSGLPWLTILRGFIPDFTQFFQPLSSYEPVLAAVESDAARSYWHQELVDAQRLRMIGAASAAVGINMTFVLPFNLLQRKWGRPHRSFAIFDLAVGMILPFVLATTFVVLASASLYHAQPFEGLLIGDGLQEEINEESRGAAGYHRVMSSRVGDQGLTGIEVSPAERQIAAMLVNRDAAQLARSLDHLMDSPLIANVVFGFGVLAMGFSTISALMLISSFVFQAAFPGLDKAKAHRFGVMFGMTGLLWPFVWQGGAQVFLAVSASALGYVMLPVAAIAFWMMINSTRILGSARPTGRARLIWNLLLGISTTIIGSGALFTAVKKKLSIFGTELPIGIIAITTMGLLILIFHRWSPKERKQ